MKMRMLLLLAIGMLMLGCLGFSGCGLTGAVKVANDPAVSASVLNPWCLATGAAKPFVASAIDHGKITPAEFPVVNGAKTVVNGVCEAVPRPSLSAAAYKTFTASATLLIGYQPDAPPLPSQ